MVKYILALIFIACSLMPEKAETMQTQMLVDVVVIVDTSMSMKEPGYDPERTSLLVSKLFSDVVPGELAVVRLLDLNEDSNLLPGKRTGKKVKCLEDPDADCEMVEPSSSWEMEARKKKFGVEVRESRGSSRFKAKLDNHLAQKSANSMFRLAFRAAQGIFDDHGNSPELSALPKTIIWLSDGKADREESLLPIIQELKEAKVNIEAIVFGKGDTSLAKKAGLTPVQISSPGDLMKAFADSLRRIFKAPYRKDSIVSVNPNFEMKRDIDEAWVVIYGDSSLGPVTLRGPDITVSAEYAQEVQPPAGAYRVFYIQQPKAGQWNIHPTGGGPEAAYAVIQRSTLSPTILAPKKITSGIMTTLIVGIRAGLKGNLTSDEEVLTNARVTAEFQGQEVTLVDDGSQGDEFGKDGRFSARVRFQSSGEVPVRVKFTNYIADKVADESVEVTGIFKYHGGQVILDLGSLKVDMESCAPLPLRAERIGQVPLKLKLLKSLPSGLNLELRAGSKKISPNRAPFFSSESDEFQVCLRTAPDASSSKTDNMPWLNLHVDNSETPEHQVTIVLTWDVQGLSFWERWGIYILWALVIVVAGIVLYGFISPQRFQPSLALVFVPDRDELDEQTPQPVKQWKGVRRGFYRDAYAYLQSDYRLSGNKEGAIAGLRAIKGGAQVLPGKGNSLYREIDGDWDQVDQEGRKIWPGDIYRVDGMGPYFRVAVSGR